MEIQSNQTDKEYWQTHVTRWQNSGLSQNAYCREQNLKSTTFSYWKRKLSGPKTGEIVNMVEITGQRQIKNNPTSLKIEMDSQISIIVEQDFDPGLLSRVVTTLRGLT